MDTDPNAIADVELRTGAVLEAYGIQENSNGYFITTAKSRRKFYDYWSVLEINYRKPQCNE